jgi:hypothetical protein
MALERVIGHQTNVKYMEYAGHGGTVLKDDTTVSAYLEGMNSQIIVKGDRF